MERKGSIVYIGGFEMPDKNAAAHRVLNNAKIFRELGYHVVFCGVDHDIAENAKEVSKIDSFDNIPAAYPRTNAEWARQQIDFSHIKKTLELYDDVKYVVAYNMHALPLFKLERFAKKKNISVIADVTEWYEYGFSLKPQKFIRWLDTNLVMRYLTKKVDGIIAISSYLERYYIKYVKKIIVLPPLIDINESIWHTEEEKKLDCLEFVYSGVPGNSNKKDKIGLIIECFGRLPAKDRFMFTVIGLTESQFLEIYPELAGTLDKLKGKVEFRGRVSHAESIAALKRADYTIIIRDRNRKNMAGFPTKFVECVTCGINIIANDFSDIAKYFPKDGESYLITDNSSVCIRDVFNKVIVETNDMKKTEHEFGICFDYNNFIGEFKKFLENSVIQ